MSVTTKTVNSALVTYEDAFHERWLDAKGQGVVKFDLGYGIPVDDTTGDPTQFVMTVVEDGGGGNTTCVAAQGVGTSLLITTDNAEYDGINLQLRGEAFKLESSKPLYFGASVTASAASDSDLLIGLFELQTALLAVDTAHAVGGTIEGVGFLKLDGSTTINAEVYKDDAETGQATYATALGTSATIFELYWDGTRVNAYVNDTFVGSFTSGLPDGDLTPTINFRTGANAAITLTVNWMRVIQAR